MKKLHRHHLVPKHMGGTDSEENLTPPITVEVHAEYHKDLWLRHGHKNDYIAWKALSGRITTEEGRLAAAKIGQDNSIKYKISRRTPRLKFRANTDAARRGGKTASKVLVKWQKANWGTFLKNASQNGRGNGIPHFYNGVLYESKRALQKATGFCQQKFYKKLKSGEIERKREISNLEKIK